MDWRKKKKDDNIMSHLNFYQICYERVVFLWVVLLQVCVIVLHYITESLANTAVKVDGKGPPTTTLSHRQPVTTISVLMSAADLVEL